MMLPPFAPRDCRRARSCPPATTPAAATGLPATDASWHLLPPRPDTAAALVLATFDLQRFGAEEDGRTEDPTARKMGKAREKGQVAKTNELPLAAGLLTSFIGLYFYLPFVWRELGALLRRYLSPAMLIELTPATVGVLLLQLLWTTTLICAPALIIAMVTGVVANLLQVGFLFTLEPLKPDFQKIMPTWERLTKQMLISKQTVMNLLKAVFKLTVIGWLAYTDITAMLAPMLESIHQGIMGGTALFLDTALGIGLKASLFLLLLALADWWFQRREHKEQLMMTKQEVKEEFRDQEGDPHVKQRIRQRAREMAQARMMQAVPEADVVITNPTHFAVALKYDRATMVAPTVVAKGQDFIALRIRALATEHGVAIYEDPPLARALYADTELGDQIPEQHFAAVAEVLALIYRSRGGAAAAR